MHDGEGVCITNGQGNNVSQFDDSVERTKSEQERVLTNKQNMRIRDTPYHSAALTDKCHAWQPRDGHVESRKAVNQITEESRTDRELLERPNKTTHEKPNQFDKRESVSRQSSVANERNLERKGHESHDKPCIFCEFAKKRARKAMSKTKTDDHSHHCPRLDLTGAIGASGPAWCSGGST